MIVKIKSKGFFIEECMLEGERKSQDIVPAQHNAIQVSPDRWFLIYDTRGFRGVDDNRSIVYQLRKGAPDGSVIKEAFVDRTSDEWDPLNEGDHYTKECVHSVAFGVPKGALIKGKPVEHEGVFAACWRRNPRLLDRKTGYLFQQLERSLPGDLYRCAWMQFRLNEAEDDIEIIQPVKLLCEKGYDQSGGICRHASGRNMGQSFVNPVPLNDDCSEWTYMLYFGWKGLGLPGHGGCAAVRFKWNATVGRYDWVETGPLLPGKDNLHTFESAIAPYGSDWLIASRIIPRTHGNIWYRTDDPFGEAPKPVFSDEVPSNCPRTMYAFPDGVIRMMTTDQTGTPYKIHQPRIPLHIFDIDPDRKFSVTRKEVLFDSLEERIPIPLESAPSLHFGRLHQHTGGRTGLISYFVRSRGLKNREYADKVYKGIVTCEEIRVSGAYYSEIEYDRELPSMWHFRA